ncbi:MAG: DNA repair and recombination protein RadB [Candidatus Thermoplasmatota archaeon]|nr:DNA repair and recombination protein RadB [Candidatus Thermoplasmatota archaeon]
MNRLRISCPPLDDLLGGGIEEKTITEIFGEAGTGKTNICLQVARECANNGKKVAYIDSEGVSLERLKQMCQGYDEEEILNNILIFSPCSQDNQEKMIGNALKIKDLSLIIVDTLNLFYRLNLEEDKEGCMRSFTRQVGMLQKNAREKNLFVIATEQVYTDKNGGIRPFTNRDVEHLVKAIIKLEKLDIGLREATIMKHRSQPEGKKAQFRIAQDGLK